MDEDLNKRVEFQDDYVSRSYDDFDNPSKMVSFVKKYSGGLIKDEEQAEKFLLGFAIIIIIISLFIAFHKKNNEEVLFTPPANAPVQDVRAN